MIPKISTIFLTLTNQVDRLDNGEAWSEAFIERHAPTTGHRVAVVRKVLGPLEVVAVAGPLLAQPLRGATVALAGHATQLGASDDAETRRRVLLPSEHGGCRDLLAPKRVGANWRWGVAGEEMPEEQN